MGFKLKYSFLNFIFSNKVKSIETRQIEIRQDKITRREHLFNDSALLLTFRLSQFLGIQPMHINKRTSKIYYMSFSPIVYILNILISLLINGVVLYGLYLILIKDSQPIVASTHTRFTETDKYIIASLFLPLSLFNICSTFYGIIRVRRILDCLECIKQIKKNISKGSFQGLQNRGRMCSIILFATFSPIILRFTAIGFNWKFSDIYQYMCGIQTVTLALLEVQFCLLVESLNLSFEAINKQLKEIVSHLNILYIKGTQRKKLSLRIGHLLIAFVESCNILNKINSNENVLLFCHVIFFPIYIILSLYFLSHALLNIVETNFSLIPVLREVLNCLNHLFFVRFIVQPCHQTQKKVIETKYLLAKIMCHIQSEDDPLFDPVDTFYKQLLLNNYAFTAMGVCDIGRPLISTSFGLAFTLLMVIKY